MKNEIEYNNLTINNKLKTKSTLKNKLVSDISTKHKASLTGRIKILMSEVTSLNKLHLLNQYLNNFPLLTAKRNDYDDWLKVYHLMQDNRHLTEEGKLLIKEIKSTMNKKREIFNWDHLIYLNNIQ